MSSLIVPFVITGLFNFMAGYTIGKRGHQGAIFVASAVVCDVILVLLFASA